MNDTTIEISRLNEWLKNHGVDDEEIRECVEFVSKESKSVDVETFTCSIGDYMTLEKKDSVITLSTPIMDELEYDCFDLFKGYCGAFGIETKGLDEDDIDFPIAKHISDCILEILQDAGFTLIPDMDF